MFCCPFEIEKVYQGRMAFLGLKRPIIVSNNALRELWPLFVGVFGKSERREKKKKGP